MSDNHAAIIEKSICGMCGMKEAMQDFLNKGEDIMRDDSGME